MRNERAVLDEDGCGYIVYCLIAFNVMARRLMAVGLVWRMVDVNIGFLPHHVHLTISVLYNQLGQLVIIFEKSIMPTGLSPSCHQTSMLTVLVGLGLN